MEKTMDTLLNAEDAKKYMDNYIVMDSSKSKKIIAYGKNLSKVCEEVLSKGYKESDFFIFYNTDKPFILVKHQDFFC